MRLHVVPAILPHVNFGIVDTKKSQRCKVANLAVLIIFIFMLVVKVLSKGYDTQLTDSLQSIL